MMKNHAALIAIVTAFALCLAACLPNEQDPVHTDPKPTNPVVTDPTNPVVTDPTNPTNPAVTDPTNPTNPVVTDPTNPTNPVVTEPTNPTNPVVTDPTNPTNPVVTEPTNPTNPVVTDPTNPTNPVVTDPTNPTNPVVTDPTNPTNPVVTDPTNPTNPVVTDPTNPTNPVVTDPTNPTNPVVTDPTTPTNPVVTDPTTPTTPTNPVVTEPTKPTDPVVTEPTTPPPTKPPVVNPGQPSKVTFPYRIPNHDVVILSVNSYDGIFLEDGKNTEVTGVSAILIQNRGDTDVEYLSVSVRCNGSEQLYIASDIPAGAYAVVQERFGEKFVKDGVYTDLDVTIADDGKLDQAFGEIMFEENEDGSITVVNLTDRDIACVRLFYKLYMPEENVYVGGITYTAKIVGLKARGSITVKPSHYYAGSCKVVMVRTYDSAN